ncbi:hypothetical protein HYH02_003431 [Chlamydomonas schloesseri]|uniref:Phosphodiesterase n=1 Tax=Chlamydomonas schloesseri TaxID=2026947 RepID=A0A835WRR0_9CHLO|nr:hypothetical protein HYH02_003431 [Chlamydomonas schloesseri]|eukprot:KAG2451651.1 hypothetical protein HYH02_003431 [Chlamydomonas schloesseri]
MEDHNYHHQTRERRGIKYWLNFAHAEVLVTFRIIIRYPITTLLLPFIAFGLTLGIGVWSLTTVRNAQVDSSKDRGAIMALDVAVWLRQQLSTAIAPVLLAAAVAQYDPHWSSVEPLFEGLAPAMLAQAPNNSIRALQLQPSGVIRSVYPLKGNENAVGLNLFTSDSNREGALKTVRDRTMTVSGPMDLVQGFYGVIIRQPVFVRGAAPNATFGVPDPLPNPACGEPCAYNNSTGLFWGFTGAVVDVDALISTPDSKLESLRQMGYSYSVTVVGAPAGTRAVASSAKAPKDPVTAMVQLPNAQWEVAVAPEEGWNTNWYGGLLAGVIMLSLAVSSALLLALVSRRRHQQLLEAILPRSLIRELDTDGGPSLTMGHRRTTLQDIGETPADLLLDMMSDLLEGFTPELCDVVFIRTALLRNMDLYTPIDVKNHIKGANLDAEVAQALMQQLMGAGPRSGMWDPRQLNSDPIGTADGARDLEQGGAGERSSHATLGGAHASTFDAFSTTLAFIVSSEAAAAGLGARTSTTPSGVRRVPSNVDSDVQEGVPPMVARGASARGGGLLGPLRWLQRDQREAATSASGLMPGMGQDSDAAADDGTEPGGGGGGGGGTGGGGAGGPSSGASARALSGGGVRGLLAAAGISGKRRGIMSLASAQNQSMDGGFSSGSGGGTVSPAGVRLTVPGAASQVQAEEGVAHRAFSVSGRTPPPGGRVSSRMVFFAAKERRNSVGPREHRERRNSIESAPAGDLLTLPPPPPPPPVIADEVERLLAKVDGWHFDMLEVAKATNGHALSVTGFFVIQRAGLISRFKLNPVVLARFLRCVESGYVNTPYHNSTHAADVLQMLHVIIHNAQLHVHYLDELGLLAMYFAAVIHDFGHPGLTGDFLINTSDQLALRYNDRSPLENHHCAAAFTLMRRPEFDLLAPLSAAERSSFRKQVIELVLATDMKQHFSILSHFNTVHRLAAYSQQQQQAAAPVPGSAHQLTKAPTLQRKGTSEMSPADAAGPPKPLDDTERSLSLQVALKCADISNLGRELECYKRWVALLEEEMFLQGDKERELGITISPLCDRTKLGVSKSQTGFFDFVALPLVHAMTSAFPGAAKLKRFFMDNYNYWKNPTDANGSAPSGTAGALPPTPAAAASGKSLAAVAPEPQPAAVQPAAAQLEQPELRTKPQPPQGPQGAPQGTAPVLEANGGKAAEKEDAAPRHPADSNANSSTQ